MPVKRFFIHGLEVSYDSYIVREVGFKGTLLVPHPLVIGYETCNKREMTRKFKSCM